VSLFGGAPGNTGTKESMEVGRLAGAYARDKGTWGENRADYKKREPVRELAKTWGHDIGSLDKKKFHALCTNEADQI